MNLDRDYRKTVEGFLGRKLYDADLIPIQTLKDLSDKQFENANNIRRKNLVDCAVYLRALGNFGLPDIMDWISDRESEDNEASIKDFIVKQTVTF